MRSQTFCYRDKQQSTGSIRDVVLTKKVWNASKNLAVLKQFQTHFNIKLEKAVGTPFPRVLAPLLYTLLSQLF